MSAHHVSAALRERLGDQGAFGLLELLDAREIVWSDRVLSIAAERYERRLSEEIAGLRVALTREIYDLRAEALKWAFLFWVGQFAAVAGLLAFMFRVTGR